MKINECAVIDIELLKGQVSVLRKNCEIFKDFNDLHAVASRMKAIDTIESIIESSKPLEPIVRDAWNCGEEIVQHEIHLDEFCHHNCDHINPKYVTVDQYINQTEI